MRRILVLWNSGSGKSTLAHDLANRLKIPALHMDEVCCGANYERLPTEAVKPKLEAFMANDAWVIDGNYLSVFFRERVEHANTVILLDFPAPVCLFRVFARFFGCAFGTKKRVGMADFQKNTISWKFLYWVVWRYPEVHRKKILRLLAEAGKEKCIVRLRDANEVERFVETVG